MRKYCLFLHLYHTHENQYCTLRSSYNRRSTPTTSSSRSFDPILSRMWGVWGAGAIQKDLIATPSQFQKGIMLLFTMRQYLKHEGRQYIIWPDIPPSKQKNSFEPTFRGLWRSGIWNMVSTQGSAPRIHGFPKGPSRRPGHQTRQLQDRRCHTSNRAIDNYNFYPFLTLH